MNRGERERESQNKSRSDSIHIHVENWISMKTVRIKETKGLQNNKMPCVQDVA